MHLREQLMNRSLIHRLSLIIGVHRHEHARNPRSVKHSAAYVPISRRNCLYGGNLESGSNVDADKLFNRTHLPIKIKGIEYLEELLTEIEKFIFMKLKIANNQCS